jgi:hypothetical protein
MPFRRYVDPFDDLLPRRRCRRIRRKRVVLQSVERSTIDKDRFGSVGADVAKRIQIVSGDRVKVDIDGVAGGRVGVVVIGYDDRSIVSARFSIEAQLSGFNLSLIFCDIDAHPQS